MNTIPVPSPWLVGKLNSYPEICDSENRIQKIKSSTDIVWLSRVLAYRDNQVSVRRAAERRLRKLTKV